MELIRVFLLSIYLFIQVNCLPRPGYSHHHVHHRIHVPQKIRTIHHTKIVKVPEHHHYFHEKEKIIKIEKEKEQPIYPPLKEEDIGHFSDLDHHNLYGESEHHNIFKKHVSSPTSSHKTYRSSSTTVRKQRKRKHRSREDEDER